MAGAMAMLRGASVLGMLAAGSAAVAAPGDWPTLGGDPGGMRFSPLAQITPANVARLRQAWVYHMKPAGAAAATAGAAEGAQARAEQAGPPTDAPAGMAAMFGGGGRFAPSESVPLVVDGVMYLGTPYGRVVALDARTGPSAGSIPCPPDRSRRRAASNIGPATAARRPP